MQKKDKLQPHLTAQEEELIRHLREHPELSERFRTILAITRNSNGPLKKADEVEGLLIEELRQLGNTTMRQWADVAEQRVGQEHQQKSPSSYVGKKKR